VTSDEPNEELQSDGDVNAGILRAYGRDFAQLYRQEREARQELEERQGHLSMLIDIHSRLARCLNVAPLLDVLAEAFAMSLGIPRVLVYVSSEADGVLSFATGRAHDPEQLSEQPPAVAEEWGIHRSLVMESQEMLVAVDTDSSSAAWIRNTYPADSVPAQVTCIALPGRNALKGFVALDGGGEPVLVEASHMSMATLLAKQAGVLLENALMYERSQTELTTVRELYEEEQHFAAEHRFESLLGSSHRMKQLFSTIRTVGDVNVPVLVLGETGTGKELVARALHHRGSRKSQPFVSVNCAALPGELVESELFGHEKGAFTGASQRRIGKVEMAENGTLFLDEIAEMPAALQAKLLRFLQEWTFERVGGSVVHQANVRIVAATNRDIAEAVQDGSLRSDLLYRLNTITLSLPPLRERMEDLPLLVDHFVREAASQYGTTVDSVHADVYEVLLAYHWPGNVRELKNVVDRAAIMAGQGELGSGHIHLEVPVPGAAEPTDAPLSFESLAERPMMEAKQELTERFERDYVDGLLRRCSGNVAQAARTAKIDRKNFVEKMRKYGLDRGDYVVRQ
jgi:transcriptional regulator with GAF, ATPase, and Fis domain